MPSMQPPAIRRLRAGDKRNTKGKQPPAIKRELDWMNQKVNRDADKNKRRIK